jgi:hypothetical protein
MESHGSAPQIMFLDDSKANVQDASKLGVKAFLVRRASREPRGRLPHSGSTACCIRSIDAPR